MAGPRNRVGELPSRDPHAQAVLGHSVPTKGTAIRQSVRRPADAEGATRRTPFRTLHTPQSSAAYPRSTRGFARGLAERQAQALGASASKCGRLDTRSVAGTSDGCLRQLSSYPQCAQRKQSGTLRIEKGGWTCGERRSADLRTCCKMKEERNCFFFISNKSASPAVCVSRTTSGRGLAFPLLTAKLPPPATTEQAERRNR